MKMTIIVVALCTGMWVVGCNTVPSDPAVVKTSPSRVKIKTTVVPDRSVQITNVSISQQNDKLKVTGILRPKSMMVRSAGHIHVNFLGLDGAAIRHLTVESNITTFFRRSVVKPRFSVSIPLAIAEVSEVRLKHHDAPLEVCYYGVGTGRWSMGDMAQ